MDIDLLSKMVKELILDNDEVTLPGVGTFVAEIVPSTFSDKGYTINPPYRKLSFRQRQSDDTLLKDFYMVSNNLPRESAEKILEDFFGEMDEVLRQKKVIIFPGLGRLRATKENNFFFVADEDLNIYPEGYGLEPISLKTHQETQGEVSAALDSLKNIISTPTNVSTVEVEEENPEEPVSSVVEIPVVEPVVEEQEAEAPVEDVIVETPEPEAIEEEVVEQVVEVASVVETAVPEPETIEPAVEAEQITVEEPSEALDIIVPEPTTEEVTEEEPIEVLEQPEVVESVPEPEVVEEPIVENAPVEAPAETIEESDVEEVIVDQPKQEAEKPLPVIAVEEKNAVPVAKVEDPVKKKSPVKIVLIVLLCIFIAAVIALILFIFLSHIAPDFIDSLLYTEEELKIINY